MTQPSTRRHVALASLALAAMTAAACGHSSPVAPEAATTSNDAAAIASATLSRPKPSDTERFPLTEGSFTISGTTSGRKEGEITGRYRGETVVTNGVSVTTLELTVDAGNGVFAGASGQLDGRGTGTFTGDGAFALEVSGFVSTDAKKNAKVTAAFEGSATVSCESPHVIVSLSDSNKVNRLTHEVGNAACF